MVQLHAYQYGLFKNRTESASPLDKLCMTSLLANIRIRIRTTDEEEINYAHS